MAKSNMDQDILKVLITEDEIRNRTQELGDQLYDRFHDKNPMFVGVLSGCFIFMADLVRAAQLKSEVEFIGLSSYKTPPSPPAASRSPGTCSGISPAGTSSWWRTFWTPATPWPF